ncbi:MAG: YhgE/Pip family protein [Microbacterium sp.]
MSLRIERARSRRPITWLTVIGVILLPVVIGGVLVAALYNPVERLDGMSAAIVNEDDPVTIDDQLVPLGRQLAAGLVSGSDEQPSNLDWVISNDSDAAAGLADGTYAAVVTIPAGFSAAATSTADGATATAATIDVQTAPDALVVDDAITATITQTAATVFGRELSKTYLENVFVGFTTLGERLGEAADGAQQLADGAHDAADGAAKLPDGAAELADGADGLASGAKSLAGGLRKLADGTDEVSSQLTSTKDGTLGGAAATTVRYANAAASSTQSLATTYQTLLAQNSCTAPTTAEQVAVCTALGQLAGDVQGSATNAGYAAGYASGVRSGLEEAAQGLDEISGGLDQSATGATKLSSGAAQLSDGIAQFGDGTQSLADGLAELADGTDDLAGGLQTASDSVPVLDDQGATDLATVLADPVRATGLDTDLFAASAIPLLSVLALWFGGIGSYVALRAVSRRTLTSRRPSALLALLALWPAAAIGAVQGVLVAGVVQLAASYDADAWWTFAALCVLTGVTFAAANQALVAVFGGAGRWIAALVGVLAVATGIVSTTPGVMSATAEFMPTAPAYHAMVAALTSAGGVVAGIAGLLVWSALAFVATTLAVARRRTTSSRALLRAAPATA